MTSATLSWTLIHITSTMLQLSSHCISYAQTQINHASSKQCDCLHSSYFQLLLIVKRA